MRDASVDLATVFVPPSVDALYGRLLTGQPLTWVRAVCAEAARPVTGPAARVTLGYLSFKLAVGLGLSMTHASRAGTLLDALQPVIDLADNIADEELDRSRGVDLTRRYPAVPRAVLPSLPPLMLGCVVAALHEDFPAARHPTPAVARRLLTLLGDMTVGQATPVDHPERVDRISGLQGSLLCLPLWLRPDALDAARVEVIERWAFAYGRLWQLHQDVQDHPDAHAPRVRLEGEVGALGAAWPDFHPFTDGAALGRAAILPRASS